MVDYSGKTLGKYVLGRKIGKGGFADVYLAADEEQKQVAIKVFRHSLNEARLQQFLQEARIAHFRHPNMITILDGGEAQIDERSLLFLVMAYAPNGNLRNRHPLKTQVALSVIVPYVVNIAEALSYLYHFQGEHLVHGDVKPENILIGEHGEILLSDFGTTIISQSDDTLVPGKQSPAGTPSYMAPEQFQGITRRASDQYSLGVMVYEWLTGTPPFTGTFIQLAYQHSQESQVAPSLRKKIPAISIEIEQIILKALAKRPEQRFPTVRAFAYALEQSFQNTLKQTMGTGNSHYKAERYEEAKTAYSCVLSLCPTDESAYSRRGDAHRHLGEYLKAIADYDRVLMMNPRLKAIWNNRGISYENLGEYQKAINDYDWALELDPFYERARINRENALAALHSHNRFIIHPLSSS